MDYTLQELSNGTKNTQIGVRMTKLWPYEVGEKYRRLLRRRDVENQRRDVAESCINDVATLPNDVAMFPNDVATLGVDFGWIFSPF